MSETQGDLFEIVQAVTQSALASGALSPIATQSRTVVDRGVAIDVRYIDALSKKDLDRAMRGDRPEGKAGPFNPFLPYDPALFVADAGPDHVLILNKFPVIPNHVLLITRAFVDQEAVVAVEDFVAIAKLMGILDGTVFFNGGKTGGGSQPHRHFQLMPSHLPIDAVVPASGIDRPQRLDVLPFRHAFVNYRFDAAIGAEHHGAQLFDLFEQCRASVGVTVQGGRLSPYNLLITRQWMMVIPRTREHWQHDGQSISINALGFGGSMLVRSPALIDVVERYGAFRILASVTE